MKTLTNLSEIKWACRRGMLELDLLLQPFAESAYIKLTESEKATFLEILTYPDPDLFAWLMGKEEPLNPAFVAMINQIRQHAQSTFRI